MSDEKLRELVNTDKRYNINAYLFVFESLEYTVKQYEEHRHVTGQQLLEGIKQYAIEKFGPLTLMVFQYWGITECEDFGEMVFNLVHSGMMGKTDQDSIEDFKKGYDFRQAFSFAETSGKNNHDCDEEQKPPATLS